MIRRTHLLVACLAMMIAGHGIAAAAPTVINLTQTGCQFVEPEGVDHQFKTGKSDDCKAINKQNGDKRLKASAPLELKPGKYIFRVTNQNVPYELGFYLRGSGLGRLTLPKVSGGGLTTGKTQDYHVDLKAGSYVYSCPLNPTPDYPIVVKP
ncbi:MAG: hypothetical protein ETSY2_26105 [Candidatus Entotheonella gemina]|uniref:EfeO-type cupredoxin-like domain-containing protein n=1 Tax=Candidatus Entotheonella gemina TaxID=1429439 RepID=W4M5K2_9BACT|nr:MAG: hypothetical protein ETSY2_26105 [Candidatus Entotheonella gemina]